MESARAAGRAAPVDHYTNETQLSDLLLSVAQCCGKGFRHKKSLRAGINHLDDGILLRGVEIRGLPDQRVQIGGSVLGFAAKRLGGFPAGFHQLACVRLLENANRSEEHTSELQ